ncbi:MAG TPA: metallopeptidase family protein [Thermoanaerobaculia bacterium]|nr:metallopeptidase family protein [Thermoanaerobaculia bacterium]
MTSPGRISPHEFDAIVEEALGGVPKDFRKYLDDNVVVVVEEEPTDEDYEETDTPDDEELFGIFRGSPFFERDRAVTNLPAQIAIFRGPILRSCATRGEAVREIRDTVVHELGHLLGLGDEEMPY